MEHPDRDEDTHVEEDDSVPKAKKRRNPFGESKLEKERRQKKRARLIVRNISYKITEEVLRKHFEQWGTLEDVNLLKRADGKLVGCAFVQYETVTQATKAILNANNKELLGRPVYVDWAMGKDEYTAKIKGQKEPEEKKPKLEVKEEEGNDSIAGAASVKDESDSDEDDEDEEEANKESADSGDDSPCDDDEEDGSSDEEDKKDVKGKLDIETVNKEKHISNDVQEGCTVFMKNVPFDAEEDDLRKVCRKYGPVYYAIINKERVSGHSKGTAFVKFKRKESADLCLRAGTEFVLMDEVLDPHPAMSREEMKNQAEEKSKGNESKDSRNLYLAREGLIMSGSKAAVGVSASDMNKRHKLEQIKTQVLKNLNRFLSRNRLSLHNLPLGYDDEKLKQMIIIHTGFRPHECRVMRENKITAEHPKGQSKGFGFMSFNTHQEALTALRKLNNNPKIFGTQNRPIVAFSIEDRAVHKVKEKRAEKSKLNNPTYKDKLARRKEVRKQKVTGKITKLPKGPQSDNKEKLKKHIAKLEATRSAKSDNPKKPEEYDEFVGTAAKPGTSMHMRSTKKIREQSQVHNKRVKEDKRKQKQHKIKQMHLAERKAVIRPKQGRKVEKDDLAQLVNKYKNMIDRKANGGEVSGVATKKKPKRTKWYKE